MAYQHGNCAERILPTALISYMGSGRRLFISLLGHARALAVFKLAVFVDISARRLQNYFIIIPMEAYTEQWLIFKEEIANFQRRARESFALLKCKTCCLWKWASAEKSRRTEAKASGPSCQETKNNLIYLYIYTLLSTQAYFHRNKTANWYIMKVLCCRSAEHSRLLNH